MSPDALAGRTRAILAGHLGVPIEAASDDALVMDDLGADSLDCFEIWIALEDAFDFEFFDDEWSSLRTVGQVIAFVAGKAGR